MKKKKSDESSFLGPLQEATHQIRSPISSAVTSLRTLLMVSEQDLLPQQRELLNAALRKNELALELVNDVLNLNRFDNVDLQTEFEEVDLEEFFRTLHERYKRDARTKSINLMVNSPHSLPRVIAHLSALNDLFHNILENAVKYTPRGGRVILNIRYDTRLQILHVSISDTGIGISGKDLSHIFKKFYRGKNARHLVNTGTGVGLALVKAAVTLHRGDIQVKSEAGIGTTFTISLPLERLKKVKSKTRSKRVVVIGGKTAGSKAAAKIRRLDPGADITVIEKDELLSYAGCGLPYYIAGDVEGSRALISTPTGEKRGPHFFKNLKNIAVLNNTEAIDIDRKLKKVSTRNSKTYENSTLPYDKLILATGSIAKLPRIKGIDLPGVYTLHGMKDAVGLRNEVKNPRTKDIIILGGGLLGMGIAESFTRTGGRVTILERREHILDFLDPEIADRAGYHFEKHGVRIETNIRPTKILGKKRVSGVQTSHGKFRADIVILTTGVHPQVKLSRKIKLASGKTGAIRVNRYLQTSDPNIYAAGDCVENIDCIFKEPLYMPLGGIAAKQGLVAGMNIAGYKTEFPGITRTIIMQGFGMGISSTGFSERELKKKNKKVVSLIVSSLDREHFISGAAPLILKIVVDKRNRRILGAQCIGTGDVSKRVDVFATAISLKSRIEHLVTLDLGYAPFFSQVTGIETIAANVMQDKISGIFKGINPHEARNLLKDRRTLWVDIRSPQEYVKGTIINAISIPLESFRGRVNELPRNKNIIICCLMGDRSYEALRIAAGHGYKRCYVLEGGLKAWAYGITGNE